MITNCRNELFFTDCEVIGMYNSVDQSCYQMMPQPLQFDPCVFIFYTTNAVFDIFKFQKEGNAGVYDVDVPRTVKFQILQ